MPKSELQQERKLQHDCDKADIIYIVGKNFLRNFDIYQNLFDKSELKCRGIFVNSTIEDEKEFLRVFQYHFQHHVPHTKIYIFMHGGMVAGDFRLSLEEGSTVSATRFVNNIDRMTKHPVHISFITCYSEEFLETAIEKGTLSLKANSTITVISSFVSMIVMIFPRIESEVKELKNFLEDKDFSTQELMRNSTIKGVLSCPEALQFAMMASDGVKRLKIPAINKFLSEEALSSHLTEQIRKIFEFFDNTAPLPKDIALFLLNTNLKSFNSDLLFVHLTRSCYSNPIDSTAYIDDYLTRDGDPNIRAFIQGMEVGTPVIMASACGSLELLKKFVDRGASINTTNERGFSVLYAAVQNGHMPIIEYCLNLCADVNQKAMGGYTPLHAAVFYHRSEAIVRLLCKHGADPNIQADDRSTPLTITSPNKDDNIVQELIKCREDVDIMLPSHMLLSPEDAQNEDNPEECNKELLNAENPIENNLASFSLTAGAAIGFWQEPKPIQLQITHDNLDAKPSQEVQAESEPHLKSNFDYQLMLGAVLGKIAVDVITWGIQWWNGETKQPVEEYISAEERTLFIESSEEQLTALYQELPKLPYYDYNEFMHAELKYDLDDLKSRYAITMREVEEFKKVMIDFKQEFIEEKEIRQAKKKTSGYKHREGQSKQSFFQSQPLLLGSDSGRAAQEFQLPSTMPSYRTMSNATLV